MKAIYFSIAALLFLVTTSEAQTSIIGGKDYGLASSSVMWMPSGGSAFLNPAELGRVHQDEFLFSTNHFQNMGSMIRTFAAPFTGTFAAGIANQDAQTYYTLGYGRLMGSYHTIGASAYIISREEGGLRFSLGSVLHFPFSGQRSGIHTGISLSNVPEETKINGGIALWLISDWLRLQANAQNRIHRAMLYGAEFLASDNFSFVFGTRAFKTMYGGISIAASTYTMDLTAGPAGGLAFSLNIIIGESAEERRSISYEDGYNLFSEKRYTEACEKFLLALEYDEYDDDSRTMAETSLAVRDSVEMETLNLGEKLEKSFDFPGAINTYSTLIRVNPSSTYAETLIVNARNKMAEYVKQLIITGDTLKGRRDIANARRNYELALKYDPQNDAASSRIDELENLSKGTLTKENLSKENISIILARAQSMLSRKQLDNAQKEYERILSLEPKNSRAKAGLNAIQAKRKEGQIESAKSIFEEGKYFEALTVMLDLAKQNIKDEELQSYIETAREKLQPEVEKRFKIGLTYYANENYDHAITVWDQALLIQPRHAGILEYRKRAEEKMKALEQLR